MSEVGSQKLEVRIWKLVYNNRRGWRSWDSPALRRNTKESDFRNLTSNFWGHSRSGNKFINCRT